MLACSPLKSSTSTTSQQFDPICTSYLLCTCVFTVAIITVDKIGVDEMVVDEMVVDELGVNEMETHPIELKDCSVS